MSTSGMFHRPSYPPVLRVVIIDDQPAIRQALMDLLKNEPDILVIGQAGDGEEGLKVVHTEQPDAILLDLEMPRLDGFAFLRLLMAKRPTPVVVVSSHATRESVFRALELGAMEFVAKPTRIYAAADLGPIRDDLLRKLRLVRLLSMSQLTERTRVQNATSSGASFRPVRSRSSEDLISTLRSGENPMLSPPRLLCIGASTGGPPAIQSLLQGLHPRLPISILITQHMPDKFTSAFVDRLARTTPWPVREAEPGTAIAPGEVVVAAGTHSLRVYRDGPLLRLQPPILDEHRGMSIVPSIDRMLESVAQAMGSQVIAVILTGMSGDAVQGVRAVHACGGRVLAEAPQSAIMASMPEEVIRTGCVHEVVPLRRMADAITRLTLSRPPVATPR